ncbi:MAG: cupredoxin domain-containing protein [Rickettsiales bacterium]|nr:cupredoxin domain-containing protein [Rickettsiales bacterium]
MRITLAALLLFPLPAFAADYVLTLKDHAFTPAEITVPAGEKFTLLVKNEDSTVAEFESHELKREKIIQGNSEAKVALGPLKPGSYPFVEEFHEDKAKGTLIVK